MLVGRVIGTPIGMLKLAAGGNGLVALLWERDRPGRVPLGAIAYGQAHPALDQAEGQLAEYFAGRRKSFDLPLDPAGTAFQRDVWSALATIPSGETRSYKEIAEAIGRPSASRAVGAAVGRNPISIIVPCHRAIGSNGALTGFAGGLPNKRYLLELESADTEKFGLNASRAILSRPPARS